VSTSHGVLGLRTANVCRPHDPADRAGGSTGGALAGRGLAGGRRNPSVCVLRKPSTVGWTPPRSAAHVLDSPTAGLLQGNLRASDCRWRYLLHAGSQRSVDGLGQRIHLSHENSSHGKSNTPMFEPAAEEHRTLAVHAKNLKMAGRETEGALVAFGVRCSAVPPDYHWPELPGRVPQPGTRAGGLRSPGRRPVPPLKSN